MFVTAPGNEGDPLRHMPLLLGRVLILLEDLVNDRRRGFCCR
jgi:hypothetical protein